MTGAERIAAERARQVAEEGYAPHHDDRYMGHDLAWAAACYAAPSALFRLESNQIGSFEFYDPWPWGPEADRRRPCDEGVGGTRSGLGLDVVLSSAPHTFKQRIRELEKAGALVAAEIDRLLRLQSGGP